MKFNKGTKLQDINAATEISQARGCLISGSMDLFTGENGELSLEELQLQHPTWDHRDMIYGLERLQEVLGKGGQNVYSVYGADEINQIPHLGQVQLIYLPADQIRSDYYAILLAGGAYGAVCTMVESLPVATKLNELGVTCFCLNYRTATQESFISGLMPQPLDDLAAAWNFIKQHQDIFSVNAENYIVGGFSAGGHTTALWGTAHLGFRKYGISSPRMLVLAYPLITMENQKPGQVTEYMNLGLFGAGYTREDVRRYAANLHVDAQYPKVFLIQSLDDDTVPIKDSEDMEIALRKAGVHYRMERPSTGGHGFGLGSGTLANGWVTRALAFINECKDL